MLYVTFKANRDNTALEKTIMVVGATGAGKSTLIDGMINYIMGVAWEDNSRLTVIDMTSVEKSKLHKQVFRLMITEAKK